MTRIILGIIVCIGVPTLINKLILKPVLGTIIPDETIEKVIRWTLSIIVLLSTYIILFRYYENRPIRELALRYASRENLLGFVTGGACVGLVLILLFISGNLSVKTANEFSVIIAPLVLFILLALTEEIVFRGILYRITEQYLGTLLALVLSAILFGISHVTNEHINFLGILSAASGGILLGALYTFSGRLWYPISFHIGWNFSQYFFGLPVSGIDDMEFYMKAVREGPEWLIGGAFGIENSVITIILVLLLSMGLIIRVRNTGKLIQPFWRGRRTDYA